MHIFVGFITKKEHHARISVILILHNLYTPNLRTVSLSIQYVVVSIYIYVYIYVNISLHKYIQYISCIDIQFPEGSISHFYNS
jgi:hypothetical protein